MVAQQSAFTIHPLPRQKVTIPDLLPDEKHLVRYVVPMERKQKLLVELAALGVKHHTLFPDLDALSMSIKEGNNILGDEPPSPPHPVQNVCQTCYVGEVWTP